jgi:hypothetical protein
MMTETDPVSENLSLKNFKNIDNAQNNSHACSNTPSSETLIVREMSVPETEPLVSHVVHWTVPTKQLVLTVP